MLRKRKNKCITIYDSNSVLFHGSINELPIREEIIIEKSILFYDDPEPCYIHRSAVRVRLISEIEAQLDKGHPSILTCPLLLKYTGFDHINSIEYEIS